MPNYNIFFFQPEFVKFRIYFNLFLYGKSFLHLHFY